MMMSCLIKQCCFRVICTILFGTVLIDNYELTASSITHSKPWFCCKCWYKFLEIEEYEAAKLHNGNGANGKSEPCKKNSFGLLKINKREFRFCVKDAFGYEYINVTYVKK